MLKSCRSDDYLFECTALFFEYSTIISTIESHGFNESFGIHLEY